MAVVKKIELSLDLTRPADEIVESIIAVLSYFPGSQLEILKHVDHRVGEMLAALQPKEKADPETKSKNPVEE